MNVNNSYVFEAFLLGSLIYFGLSNIDVNVNVYVDGEKATAAEAAKEAIKEPANEG